MISGLASQAPTYSISNTVSYPGFGAAMGIVDPQFGKVASQNNTTLTLETNGSQPSTITFSLSLWLVPLGALALLGVAWFLSQRRASSRAAALSLIAISALSLVMELSFVVGVNSLESDVEHTYEAQGGHLVSTLYSVSWGAWLAMVVTAAGLVAGIFALMQARKTVISAAALAQPVGVQYPGAPPTYLQQ
jgi:hypothetical protein